MTLLETRPVDYRQLMKKVEGLVATLDELGEVCDTIQAGAEAIVAEFRQELGILGGRLYRRREDQYVLQTTFGEAKPVSTGFTVSRDYPPIEQVLDAGVLFMRRDDPGIDPNLEDILGVDEFATIAIGDGEYILSMDLEGTHRREDVLFSLGILRHALNEKLRRERMEDVFKQARQIQLSILPRDNPEYGPYDLVGKTDSMESVGGDFYDFIPLTDKILGITLADVSGHGLPAALQVRDIYMGMRMGLERDFKIVRTVERLNRIINASTLTSRFVSLFYGELETSGNFISVNAGHPPPFHLAASGRVTYLEQGGPVLGPLSDATYDRSFVAVQPGDMLVLYTDGITETLNAKPSANGEEPEEFGVERLLQVARSCQGCSAADIVEAVFEKLQQWSGDAPARDDCTVIVVVRPR